MIPRTALMLAALAAPAAAQQAPATGSAPAARPQAAAPNAPPAMPPAVSPPVSPPVPLATPRAAPRTPVQRESPPAQPRAPNAAKPPKPPQRPVARPRPPPPAIPAVPAAPPAPAVPIAPEPERPAEPGKGSNTGLPVPRFVSLRSDEVNLRTGPGTRYPIDWVYKRRDLPMEVEREFEVWRLVRDQEGTKGWVHQATLVARRTAVVVGQERTLRSTAREDGNPVARLKPGVIIRLRGCDAGAEWCQASVGDYRGWLKRNEFWGTYPGEAVQ